MAEEWHCAIWENGEAYLYKDGKPEYMVVSERTGEALAAYLNAQASRLRELEEALEQGRALVPWLAAHVPDAYEEDRRLAGEFIEAAAEALKRAREVGDGD